WIFETGAFAEKAATIRKEKEDALRKQELEELQGLSSSLAAKKRGADEEDPEDTQQNAPDRDAVEKSLIHAGTQADDKHRNPPTLEVRRFLEAMKQEAEKCQLSEAELRGFVAEAEIDQSGDVAYVEHIKTWVPILFELRKSRIYDGILAKEWGPDSEDLINLSSYEAQFPLHVAGEDRPASVASSASEKSTRAKQKKSGRKGSRSSSRGKRSDSQSSLGSDRAMVEDGLQCLLPALTGKRTMLKGLDFEPCGYQTLRYVAHACAKEGAVEAAYHLSRLQRKCGRTKYITAGSRVFQSAVESSALYLQSTADQMPKLLAGHGARVAEEIESLMELKNEILALTPNRRFLMLTEAFNQLIRWYGRARLVPQALRACEIMNELGIPRACLATFAYAHPNGDG
ncbi:unnamed protein product, partial [Effrenium voratum]